MTSVWSNADGLESALDSSFRNLNTDVYENWPAGVRPCGPKEADGATLALGGIFSMQIHQ